MEKKIRRPSSETKFGKALLKIMLDHPKLISLWDERVSKKGKRLSDRSILKEIMDDFEYLEGITWKVCILPYSVALHVKLKKLLSNKQ